MIASADEFIEQQTPLLVNVRRHLHRHPELSGKEFDTTRFLADRLVDTGIEYRLGPEHRGIIVDLGNQESDKRLAIRADLDALSVHDAKNVDYRSQVDSVMHACGHDAHSTILLGTVKTLHHLFEQNKPDYAIRAIFQPEEESATGARRMIDFGVLDDVTAIVAAHVDPHRPVGKIGLRSGVVSAHCDEIFVEVCGRSGHAARPHLAIDPIEKAVEFISKCYEAVPRYSPGTHPVVLSFTSFHGGQQSNVIPDQVNILGTMRSLDRDARERAIASIQSAVADIEDMSGATIKVHFGLEVPSILADPDTTRNVEAICCEVLGADHVQQIESPSMGGEDFAFYSQRLPAAFIRLGCSGDNIGHFPLHNSQFDIDEKVLGIGASVMTHVALNFFSN